MTVPRVFISSTCYDLTYIRENLERFIKTLGYEPIRSDKGKVFYDPKKDVMDSCIDDVPSCQLFVLIIGGRFGSEYKDTGKSITNIEYNKAFEEKVPIFIFIEKHVFEQYKLWMDNRDVKNIKYSSVDSTKIFEFIDEVKNASYNNAIFPFETFQEIHNYLLQQWSGMMYNFLTNESQYKRMDIKLSTLEKMNEKVELITKQILKSSSKEKLDIVEKRIELSDFITEYIPEDTIMYSINRFMRIDNRPEFIIKNEELNEFITDINKSTEFHIELKDGRLHMANNKVGYSSTTDGLFKKSEVSLDYSELRKNLINYMKKQKISLADILIK